MKKKAYNRVTEGFSPPSPHKRDMLKRIVPVIQTCHRDVKKHIRGPVLAFWLFHVVNDYASTLKDAKSRMVDQLPALLTAAENLEKAVGMIGIMLVLTVPYLT